MRGHWPIIHVATWQRKVVLIESASIPQGNEFGGMTPRPQSDQSAPQLSYSGSPAVDSGGPGSQFGSQMNPALISPQPSTPQTPQTPQQQMFGGGAPQAQQQRMLAARQLTLQGEWKWREYGTVVHNL